jgi:hypothetical protein
LRPCCTIGRADPARGASPFWFSNCLWVAMVARCHRKGHGCRATAPEKSRTWTHDQYIKTGSRLRNEPKSVDLTSFLSEGFVELAPRRHNAARPVGSAIAATEAFARLGSASSSSKSDDETTGSSLRHRRPSTKRTQMRGPKAIENQVFGRIRSMAHEPISSAARGRGPTLLGCPANPISRCSGRAETRGGRASITCGRLRNEPKWNNIRA